MCACVRVCMSVRVCSYIYMHVNACVPTPVRFSVRVRVVCE